MRKELSILMLSSLLILPGCAKNESENYSGETLVIYNVEDYISNGDDDSVDLIAKFEEETGCSVKYYTYDTNETMYNQFKLQKEGTYDLVLGSEYMIQKMVKEGLCDKFEDIEHNIPNYYNNCSPMLREKLNSMKVTVNGVEETLDSYALGYMWGTLGLIYDPNCSDTINDDIMSWSVLYNETYKDKISIKNSMRDAFDVGLIYAYSQDADYQVLLDAYLNNYSEETARAFNAKIQEVFDFKLDGSEESIADNREKIARVKEALIALKQNIFGLETDSGKVDIIEGSKIYMDLAYSGDAVYSIQTAMDENEKELRYVVPLEGGNIWYDAWMLPKGSQHRDLAYKFLDFLCDSGNAASNSEYIGYTPFIIGEEMYTSIAGMYGATEFDINQEYSKDSYVYKDGQLYCVLEDEVSGEELTNEQYFESLEYDPLVSYKEGDMVSYNGKFYNCVEDGSSIENFEEVEGYDLTHIYGGSLENRCCIVYPFYGLENQLETQYPSEEIIYRCAIMNDFGEMNDEVIIMWGQFKAYTNMTPYYVILIVFLVIVIAVALYFVISKQRSARFKRNKNK